MNTVLIIDDNPQEIRVLGEMLMRKNFNPIFSLNGYEGFKHARDAQPDLILLDRMMPNMDGLAVCRLLKNDTRTADIPTIFLTAMESVENKIEGLELGACDYITKPCHPDELITRVRTHINLHNHYRNDKQGTKDEKTDFINCSISPVPASRSEIRVRKAQALYLHDLTANLTVSEVANKIGTHARQLSEDFNLMTGKRIQHWLQEKRMEQACDLLLKTEFDVGLVAENVGYTSVTTFSNTFRDYFGMPPKEYRRYIGSQINN